MNHYYNDEISPSGFDPDDIKILIALFITMIIIYILHNN